jgi:nucleoside-diphosphate-sugar epimerase
MDFKDAKVLVTGGLGFIGSSLAHRLVGLGADVTLVDCMLPRQGGNLVNIRGVEDRVRINYSDIGNVFSLRQLVPGMDFIFNLAGQTSHLDSMHDPVTDLNLNCVAHLALLETCRAQNLGCKLVFASTRQIYGKPDYLPVDEDHPIRPVDVNGINKVAGEAYHLLYHRVYGLRSTALRLTNTYGPRMRIRDARQTFLGVWIKAILQGEPFEVWGGEQLRDFSYVDDVVDAMLLAATTPEVDGLAFNLSGEPVVSLKELADLLVQIAGARYQVREFPAERLRIDIGDYHADDRRFRAATGWAPKTPLAEGLERTLSYYRGNLEPYL